MFTDSLNEVQHVRREVKGERSGRDYVLIRRKDSMVVLKVVLRRFVL